MLSGMAAAGAESMHVEPGTLDVAAGVTVTYGIES
jgi:hypothetical protein